MNERESRLHVFRQYLKDLDENSATLLETDGSVSYGRWNFQRLVDAAIAEWDVAHKNRRVGRAAQSFTNLKMEILSTPLVECTLGNMQSILVGPESFLLWLQTKLLGPLFAEEERILAGVPDGERVIWMVGGVRTYLDTMGECIRFKLWESAHFPHVQVIPLRHEPSPDELKAPPRMEG